MKLLFVIILFISYSNGLDMTWNLEGTVYSSSCRSPTLTLKYSNDTFNVVSANISIPSDSGYGCEQMAFSGSLNTIVLINDKGCLISDKIKYAFIAGAKGVIISLMRHDEPGYHYTVASESISSKDDIFMPAVEISNNCSNTIIEKLTGATNILISIKSGGFNAWRDLFESTAFKIFFRSGFAITFFIFSIYSFIRFVILMWRLWAERFGGKETSYRKLILLQYGIQFSSNIILGFYMAIDPAHSVGIINELNGALLLALTTEFIYVELGLFLYLFSRSTNVRTGILKTSILIVLWLSFLYGLAYIPGSILTGIFISNIGFDLTLLITALTINITWIILMLFYWRQSIILMDQIRYNKGLTSSNTKQNIGLAIPIEIKKNTTENHLKLISALIFIICAFVLILISQIFIKLKLEYFDTVRFAAVWTSFFTGILIFRGSVIYYSSEEIEVKNAK